MTYFGQNGWTAGQYQIYRWLFGVYLAFHFATLVPWGKEMFSNEGCLAEASLSPLVHLFPNILAVYDSPLWIMLLLLSAVILSFCFAWGIYDRSAALVLWYIWACLFGRNPFISNPALPYVGILLLAHACIPKNQKGIPQSIFLVVWILMAAGYSYSGYTKLVSPSWLDGTAVEKILSSPLARPGVLKEIFFALPPLFLQMATYVTLVAELCFLPLALLPAARPFIWAALLAMHISFLDLIDFADLSLGMIFLHFFTFDPRWIKPRLFIGAQVGGSFSL
ncbi:MAG: hypothetical protein K2W82_09180 [Candidatus Obscuribacterales bacterium]|nr:hypothetical protein [Candidatus Obscuribacterales bacterium]